MEPDSPAAGSVRGPANGCLFVVGGGDMGPLTPTFLGLGGGPTRCRLVIFPTALDDETLAQPQLAQLIAQPWLDAGLPAACISVLHTRDRETADSLEFSAALREATAVWFEGGRQWRFVDAYRGTNAELEVREVLARGGVVGGSSAGATILGEFLTRGDTHSNQLLVGDHTEGFGLLGGVAIDQHCACRRASFHFVPGRLTVASCGACRWVGCRSAATQPAV
jgi:cyanophycinase